MRRATSGAAAVAVALVVALGACSFSPTGGVPVATLDVADGHVDPIPVGPADALLPGPHLPPAAEHYGSLRLDPPPALPGPVVSLAEVEQRFEREKLFPSSGRDAPREVRLASYRNELVWAYIYPGVARRSGPGGPAIRERPSEPAVRADTRCSFVVLFDAATGTFILGSQSCSPPPGT